MDFLIESAAALTWKHFVMYAAALALIVLAVRRNCEPALLLPLGFGTLLVNLPAGAVINQTLPGAGEVRGVIQWLFETGIETAEIMPVLLFTGIGALIDFSPLIARPVYFFTGAAAHLGVFVTIVIAALLGFELKDAAAIGVTGTADGPVTVLAARILRSPYAGTLTAAAYSYIPLVPVIQPVIIKLLTTRKERRIRMTAAAENKPPQALKIIFPVAVTVIAGIIAPAGGALIGFLMFGNLVRECPALGFLRETAQRHLTGLITLFLGIAVSFTLQAERFVTADTLKITALGLLSFTLGTAGGILFIKLINLFLKEKINPMIGAAGVSAFPASARIVQKMALQEDPQNFLLSRAVSANASGQILSVITGGLVLSLVSRELSG